MRSVIGILVPPVSYGSNVVSKFSLVIPGKTLMVVDVPNIFTVGASTGSGNCWVNVNGVWKPAQIVSN